jgi:hypothetical protein
MTHLPFSVSRRKGRRFYYVQFKGENGEYLPAVSTRQVSEAAAIETAFQWFREGRPAGTWRENQCPPDERPAGN